MRRSLSVIYFLICPFILFAQKLCRQPFAIPLQTAFIPSISTNINSSAVPGSEIVIPVVVHIIQSPNQANISIEQVQSQIDALNRDYNAKNPDLDQVPSYFKDRVANCGFRFVLARVDPGGQPSTGIRFRQTQRNLFGLEEDVKFTSKGGDDAWPRDHYFNIWVCSMISNIDGYASMPGAAPELDGVVINQAVFGTLGKSGKTTNGRIAVHETGHWLGLKHIWGDGYCGDDGVDDTPQQKGYSNGCPGGIQLSCGSSATGDMYMNFMDLTDDACMYMFTLGQKEKMRQLFAPGNSRNPLLLSQGLNENSLAIIPGWQAGPTDSPQTQQIRLSPVPASSQLFVDLGEISLVSGKALVIYNVSGQVIQTIPVTARKLSVNISGLKTGQYFLKVGSSDLSPAKFIKL